MPTSSDRIWLAVYVLLVVALACGDFYLPESFARLRGLAILFVCLVGIAHVHVHWQIGDYDTGADAQRAANEIDPPVDNSKRNP